MSLHEWNEVEPVFFFFFCAVFYKDVLPTSRTSGCECLKIFWEVWREKDWYNFALIYICMENTLIYNKEHYFFFEMRLLRLSLPASVQTLSINVSKSETHRTNMRDSSTPSTGRGTSWSISFKACKEWPCVGNHSTMWCCSFRNTPQQSKRFPDDTTHLVLHLQTE